MDVLTNIQVSIKLFRANKNIFLPTTMLIGTIYKRFRGTFGSHRLLILDAFKNVPRGRVAKTQS